MKKIKPRKINETLSQDINYNELVRMVRRLEISKRNLQERVERYPLNRSYRDAIEHLEIAIKLFLEN